MSFQPANLHEFTPAELNRPYTVGDSFWSGPDGRGELQTDNAALRFNGNTSLTIQDLSSEATQIKLASGTLSVRLHTLAPGESFEVDATHRSFQLTQIGQYRIEIAANDDNLITVRFGHAEASKDNGETESISQGMQAQVSGDALHQHTAPAIDEFDTWCIKRDQREDASASAHYVSRDLPGYADLDDAGAWRTLPNYGAVWFPSNMDPDWVPDRFGHFIQADPWDAHWVEDKPWGFAPFHYGRWVNVHNEWGWIPPTSGKAVAGDTQFAVRPYYAPALVAFAKFPPGKVQPGAVVGWFPLGPGEAWVPGFNASPNYLMRVNVSNTAIADRTVLDRPDLSRMVYANRDAAMTAVPSDAFASGRVVGKQFVRIPPDAVARAAVTAGPDVDFTREARLGPRGVAPPPPPEIVNRSVVAHRIPPTRMAKSQSATLVGHVPMAGRVGLPENPVGKKEGGVIESFTNVAKKASRNAGNMFGLKKPATKPTAATSRATSPKTTGKTKSTK